VSDDPVFRALADPSRRLLLDRLFERDGRTLTDLQSQLDMTRFGVMKHLRVLEEAGLITTRKEGREKFHFLNPVPVQLIYDRWVSKYTRERVGVLTALKTVLEEGRNEPAPTPTTAPAPATIEIFINATPQRIWEALISSDSRVFRAGKLLESDPPRRLVHTGPHGKDRPGRVTWEIELTPEDVCKVTVTYDGPTVDQPTVPKAAGGWSYVLSSLKSRLETGEALPERKRG
jgi:DNA-binding transcriptional ArsR family regulator